MSPTVVDPAAIANILDQWLSVRLTAAQSAWFCDRCQAVSQGDKKALFLAFGLVSRKLSKADLQLSNVELDQANSTRTGWNSSAWTIEQAARTRLLLSFPAPEPTAYVAVLDQLFDAGEMHELVALYQSLPLLPHQSSHALRCAEGIRTNIKAVFLAIAHHNPFPSEQLNDDQWNQLVLKCLFVGVTLDPVVGLDRRGNAPLAKMLTDFAHERWAAQRPVSPELWRCVSAFADDAMLADLQKALTTGNELERQGAALALSQCPHPQAESLLVDCGIDIAKTNWTTIAASL
jgi:hypothetical protein